jgi:aryl-alcohol dehydrogenase-like predicted oxidoreductase
MPVTNKIVLGTVQFGLDYGINNIAGKPGGEEVKSILDFAFQNNIHLLDTAEAYGDSHEAIGAYHKSSSNKFNVITKFSSKRKDLSGKLTIRISQNLKVLNIDSLYAYMFHSFNDFKSYNDIFKNEIKELKDKGIVNKFGVSVYTNDEIDQLLNYDNIDLIQLPFNLFDNSSQRSTVISQARKRGIEIHTRSAFLQGLFFKNRNSLPVKLVSLKPYLDKIEGILKANDLNMNDLSLNYVIQQDNIDNVLIGVDSVDQLKENIKSLQHQISDKVIRQIDSINVKETALLNPSNWT